MTGRNQHARLEEPAVERVDAQQPGRRGDSRDACAVARLCDGAQEARAGDRHEDRPYRPGVGEDHDGGRQGALSERATTRRPGSARSDQRATRRASARTPSARISRGCTARAPRVDASGRTAGRPSATTVSQSPYVEIPAATSRRADRSALWQRACCPREEACRVDRHVHSWIGWRKTKRDAAGRDPRRRTQRIQKPRASPGVKGWGISPRLRRPPFPPPWIPPAPRSSSYRSGKVGFDRVRRSRSLRSRAPGLS